MLLAFLGKEEAWWVSAQADADKPQAPEDPVQRHQPCLELVIVNIYIRPVHKNLFLEFPKMQGRFMLHFDR